MSHYSVDLWSQVILIPVLSNERPGPGPLQPEYKLRPIALAEALLKAVEAAVCMTCRSQLLRVLEPHQLGAGTPGGVSLVVKAKL